MSTWGEAGARRALDQAPDAYVSIDSHGTVTGWNAAAVETFGWHRDEVVGREFGPLLLGPTGAELHRDRLHEFRETRSTDLLGRHTDVAMSHRDGRMLRLDCVTWSVEDDDGAATLHAFMADVTEQREAVDGLLRADDDLTQFSAAMAHDLRQPLTVVQGYAELLVGALADGDPLLGVWADRIETAAERGIAVVDGLLGYLAVGRVRPARDPVDLTALLRAVALEHQAPGSRPARIDVRPLPTVVGDAGLLAQLFGNLIGNAVKHAPPGREVEVVVDALPTAQQRAVVIRVRDNGEPVAPDDRDRIFAMFERGPDAVGVDGSGIGLAFCRRVAELHGGHIALDPSTEHEEGGNRFCVWLEAADPAPALR